MYIRLSKCAAGAGTGTPADGMEVKFIAPARPPRPPRPKRTSRRSKLLFSELQETLCLSDLRACFLVVFENNGHEETAVEGVVKEDK
ncbi:hypothetical protein Tco_1421747 [Tanacetum coccineum]